MKKMQKGFTLIELMVVIVIIGILAAVALPKMFGMSAKAKASEIPAAAATYERLQQAAVAEVSEVTTTKEALGFSDPNSKYFTFADAAGNTVSLSGLEITTSAKLNDCASGSQNWSTTVDSEGKITRAMLAVPDCDALTPNFVKSIKTP
jgi:prepilin-type N-terminal cleavage/methylation domain-containing protein